LSDSDRRDLGPNCDLNGHCVCSWLIMLSVWIKSTTHMEVGQTVVRLYLKINPKRDLIHQVTSSSMDYHWVNQLNCFY
jgi:hypothetical protein